MAKINGTSLLVYADGVLIAAQKSCTVSWEQDLPGATTKDIPGWEEHINGVRRATCDFDGLYSTSGLTADGLINYILSRSNIVLLIDGGGFPIVGEATPKGVSIAAVKEEAATISGSFKFQGPAWILTGAYVNLITDPAATNVNYDTLTKSGLAITSAINSGDSTECLSNNIAITNTSTYKLITFLTLNSGEAPSVQFMFSHIAYSNVVPLTAGVNVITLTAINSLTCQIVFTNTSAATNWSTSNIYCFKV